MVGLGRLTFDAEPLKGELLKVMGDNWVGEPSLDRVTIMGGGAAKGMPGVLTGDTCPLLKMSSSSLLTITAVFLRRLLNLVTVSPRSLG